MKVKYWMRLCLIWLNFSLSKNSNLKFPFSGNIWRSLLSTFDRMHFELFDWNTNHKCWGKMSKNKQNCMITYWLHPHNLWRVTANVNWLWFQIKTNCTSQIDWIKLWIWYIHHQFAWMALNGNHKDWRIWTCIL